MTSRARPAASDIEPPYLTDAEFERVRAWLERESGIHLGGGKRGLVVGRLGKRLRALGLDSFSAYFDRAMGSRDAEERVRLLDALCTNETHFFREAGQFDYLEKSVFPDWRARSPRRLRAWSAACSTGEEPYSLAMVLLSHFPAADGWDVEVLGTDLSQRALAAAAVGEWPIEKAREIPEVHRRRFMLRGTGPRAGVMRAGAEVRRAVRFQSLNLNAERYDVPGPFDLILCRNVIIYFASETKRRVVRRLMSHLAPSGLFLSGHAESLHGLIPGIAAVHPTVYRRPAGELVP